MLAVMKDGVFAKAPRRSRRERGAGDAPSALHGSGAASSRTAQRLALWLLVGVPIAVFSLWAMVDNTRLYLVTLLNGLTLASLYFIVASGFTLVFGLMRNVNLAHGSLYLLGGYVGFIVAEHTGWWIAGAGRAASRRRRSAGLLIQVLILRHMQGQDLRQTMVTIGLSIVIADVLLWIFTGAGAPDGGAGVAAGADPRHPADQRLLGLPAEPARLRHRHRRRPVAAAEPHARRHDDPRRRRRPRACSPPPAST